MASDATKLPETQDDDKPRLVGGYVDPWQSKLIRLAAAELDLTRSKFITDAAVERAVTVLRESNPAALEGTPFALVAKSA